MALSSTQIGVIGENLLINAVMKASDGRLSPFQPIADDDGLDVLFFDKQTGRSIAIQLKCRTNTLHKKSGARGNVAHFELRKSTFNQTRKAWLVAALCNEDLTQFETTWFIPFSELPLLAAERADKWVIRPSKSATSRDRCSPFRCGSADDLAERILLLTKSS